MTDTAKRIAERALELAADDYRQSHPGEHLNTGPFSATRMLTQSLATAVAEELARRGIGEIEVP